MSHWTGRDPESQTPYTDESQQSIHIPPVDDSTHGEEFPPAASHQRLHRRNTRTPVSREDPPGSSYVDQVPEPALPQWRRWMQKWWLFHKTGPDAWHGIRQRRMWYGLLFTELLVALLVITGLVTLGWAPVTQHRTELAAGSTLALSGAACQTIAQHKRTQYAMYVPHPGQGWFACFITSAGWTTLWLNDTSEWTIPLGTHHQTHVVNDPQGDTRCRLQTRFAETVIVSVLAADGFPDPPPTVTLKHALALAWQFMHSLYHSGAYVDCFQNYLHTA